MPTQINTERETDQIYLEIERQDSEYETWLEKVVHSLPVLTPALYGKSN